MDYFYKKCSIEWLRSLLHKPIYRQAHCQCAAYPIHCLWQCNILLKHFCSCPQEFHCRYGCQNLLGHRDCYQLCSLQYEYYLKFFFDNRLPPKYRRNHCRVQLYHPLLYLHNYIKATLIFESLQYPIFQEKKMKLNQKYYLQLAIFSF